MQGCRWLEGDIHNHENGSISIEDHVEKMHQAGYDFICLQYKDKKDPAKIPDSKKITRRDLLVIPGAEQAFQSERELWAHFGFMPFEVPMPDTITDHFDIEQGLAEAERRSPGCLKMIHHPSDRRWTMGDLRKAYEGGARFLEVNPCDEPMDYAIKIWDRCLSAGLPFFGTLSTDAHGWRGIRRFGSVMVRDRQAIQEDILDSLRRGNFVSVEEGCRARPVQIRRPSAGVNDKAYEVITEGGAEIRFLGSKGCILKNVVGERACYDISGDEGYIRAEVLDPKGMRLFTQPILIRST